MGRNPRERKARFILSTASFYSKSNDNSEVASCEKLQARHSIHTTPNEVVDGANDCPWTCAMIGEEETEGNPKMPLPLCSLWLCSMQQQNLVKVAQGCSKHGRQAARRCCPVLFCNQRILSEMRFLMHKCRFWSFVFQFAVGKRSFPIPQVVRCDGKPRGAWVIDSLMIDGCRCISKK